MVEKFRNVAPIAIPGLTAELEDWVQRYKNSWNYTGMRIVMLIVHDLIRRGEITEEDGVRMIEENDGSRVKRLDPDRDLRTARSRR